MNERISAIIIMFSYDDKLIPDESNDNLKPLSHTSVKKVKDYFTSKGFEVTNGVVNLSITGRKELFNNFFNIDIVLIKHPQTGDFIISSNQELPIPKELVNEVSNIIFPEVPEFFP